MPLYLRHRSDKVTDRGVPAVRRILYYRKDKAMFRDKTKKVWIGDVCIGGGSPVAIQSMTNTSTEDVEATVAQILELERAGMPDYSLCGSDDGGSAGACKDQGEDSYSAGGGYSF